MKKFIAYLAVCVAIAFTSCTDFGDENQLTLPPAPTAEISGVTPASETVTFKVAPSGPAGYYAWLIVESATVDSTLQATNILKQTANGLAKGIVEYSKKSDTTVVVKDLTPYTVYQIYAVASSSDGVVSAIKNVSFRTLDDGGKPTPTAVSVTDTIVTITFHEPLQKGNGNVYVSYFAKNTVSGHKPLKVAPGYESYNPQDILVNANSISVDGTKLIVKLPNAPAGAYASVTYDAGAVLDLEGNGSSAYTQKADTLINGVPSRGLTVHLANKTWKLHSEFEEINPDTVEAFSDWKEKLLFAFADEGTIIRKAVATKTPTVVYNQPGRKSTLDVKDWGILSNAAAFYLPEEPPFGATIDLNVPAGAFEDIYGNTNESLAVEGNYLYSYGYDYDDVTGTYDVDLTSYFDGALPTESGIIIEKDPDSDDLLIKNLLSLGTVIKGTFDPVRGTISLEDSQLLMENVEFSSGISNILFVDAEGFGPVIFKVPAPGLITSSQMWGYYLEQIDGWYDAFTASTWTRTSTSTSAPASLNSVNGNRLNTVIKEVRKLNK
ncbi:hypothetical protein [Petrimonas mucosa]|uniref:Fibronectin type-III domain-containing protein n=1 Tax=Petrimonas mucosa TaxID=1642646 RepID=A0A1G4G9M8_9BACT|nr:hypothetical protein [Petrimonas mucosa]SCM59253.1 putative protein {ECO:0000313/EMBL:CCZ09218,1} [Petrimonas mucosa]